MELESLKYIWHIQEAGPSRSPDNGQLLALLHKRSRGPVARMRRNLSRELLLIGATYIPAILIYLLDFGGKLSEIAWLLILLLVFFAGYYYRKNRLLKEMECAGCHLRSNLERQVRTLTKYTRFYTVAGTGMIPVMAVLSFFIIRRKLPPAPGASLFYRLSGIAWWESPLFWALALVPVTIAIYYINVWYVNKLYGRHIMKLRELLQEMNEG